jgi:hypothetical protein
VQLPTVGRPLQKLERAGLRCYCASNEFFDRCTGRNNASHRPITTFASALPTTASAAPSVTNQISASRSVITAVRRTAERGGKLAHLFIVTDTSNRNIVRSMRVRRISNRIKNYSSNSIVEVSTFRLLGPVRTLRNSLPLVNVPIPAIRPD